MTELSISLEAELKIVNKDEVKSNYIVIDSEKYGINDELGKDEVIVVEINTK